MIVGVLLNLDAVLGCGVFIFRNLPVTKWQSQEQAGIWWLPRSAKYLHTSGRERHMLQE